MRALLVLNSLGYIRFFDGVVRGLLERGHDVHLLLERTQHDPGEQAWLDELGATPGFTWSTTNALREGEWGKLGTSLRRTSDYVRFLGPTFARTPHLVTRAENRVAPGTRRRLRRLRAERAPMRRLVGASLDLLERAFPVSPQLEREIALHEPGVLVIAPHLMPGARHSEYVRVARALGVPSVIAVASWDNLSSKQLIRELPDRLLVWNETQVREAVELHRIPRERIAVTGAQSFDQWFDWEPSPREEFLTRVGLDSARPYVLYLGGSLFPGELTEAEWARRWVAAVRSDRRFDGVGILLRPHPNRGPEWSAVPFDAPDTVVWPPGGWQMPVDRESRAGFYDSLHHAAAVVGLNTSAMIEAAIVGRTVHTLLVPEFQSSQTGTLHFDYLLQVAGGFPKLAESLGDHLDQLAASLDADPAEGAVRAQPFLASFIRPHGAARPATPIVLDEIEAAMAHRPDPPPGWTPARRAARGVLEMIVLSRRARAKLRLLTGRVQPS